MAEEMKSQGMGTTAWNALNSIAGVAGLASALGIGIPALVKANNAEDKAEKGYGFGRGYGYGHGDFGVCSDNSLVNRYELSQSQRIAQLEADRATDAKLLSLYEQTVAENKAIRAEIADVIAANNTAHETIYKELVANRERELIHNGRVDKDLALLRQADFFRNQLNDCRYVTAKKVVAKDDICPAVMPLYNSWTAPTATAEEATTPTA